MNIVLQSTRKDDIRSGMPGWTIAVDVGGTFTDMVATAAGETTIVRKFPTSREDPGAAIAAELSELLAENGLEAVSVTRFLHGTTIATNAVLERRGARLGLITTEGFADVLEIGRQMRSGTYSIAPACETPVFLCPGERRLEVAERIAPDGSVIVPLDEAALLAAADRLVADGVEAIAVVFLFSFVNPVHERRAAELIAARHPGVALSLSSIVDPAFREYERTAVTAFDAYVKPVVDGYLARLANQLAAIGVGAPVQVMQSRGGLMSATSARERPVRLFLSGPSAGVVGACTEVRGDGFGDIITIDIGGTSADISLVEGGEPKQTSQARIGGYPVRVGMVDINAVAAGGGSIAWIDGAGALRIGPHSAGSRPGPSCFSQGGQEPTVTDASLVLGYLDPEHFANGRISLSPTAAERAITNRVAGPLNLSLVDAALGIHSLVNARMAEAIRLVSLKRGHDPRRFVLVALGGAGGIHATRLAEELDIGRVLVPRRPGVTAAIGLLSASVEHEALRSVAIPTAKARLDEIERIFRQLDEDVSVRMRQDGVAAEEAVAIHSADLCYIGQSHYLEVPFARDASDPLAEAHRTFLAEHRRVFGHARAAPSRIVNLRVVHRGPAGSTESATPAAGATAPARRRRVVFLGAGALDDCPVYDRETLQPGTEVRGGAVIDQNDSTTVVPPGWTARVLASGAILIER